MTRSSARPAVLASLLLLLVLTAGPAAARDPAPSGRIVSFGVGGGVTLPVDDAKKAF
ncbi:MAG: hypothetical protein ABIP29_01090 [Candidatus Eisenbacteria bacterium]